MTPFTLHPEFYDRPIRLDATEQKYPLTVLREFFDECPLGQVRQTLWQMVETALQADHTLYDKAPDRHHLLWFYRSAEAVLEAGWLLSRPGYTARD